MKPKALVCDFDGTLVSSFLFRAAHSSFLRPLFAGIFCRLPVVMQIFLARPTQSLKEVKDYQSGGVKIIVLTARKDTKSSRRRMIRLLKAIDLNPDKIFLRPGSVSAEEHKQNTVKKIAREYELVGFLEDEGRFRRFFKEYGSILSIHL